MKQLFTLMMSFFFAHALQAATTYNINSNTKWSSALPSYCGGCTINIATGVTLTLNSGMCDNCSVSGGTLDITGSFSFQSSDISNTIINATSSFSLNNSNSFDHVTAVISGSSSFTANGTLTITNSNFTFENTASFTSNGQLNLTNSNLHFNDNSHLVSNSAQVNLKTSAIIAGDGSKNSKAYLIFYSQLNLVDATSFVLISNVNNYYSNWNVYNSLSTGNSYNTTSNYQPKVYGGSTLTSSGPLPITVLATTIGNFKQVGTDPRTVTISWTLSDASGGETLQIERSSDGQHFIPLSTMPAQLADASYSYTDNAPLPGENDYRIRVIGADGNISYSKVISAQIKETGGLHIFPNPCTGGNVHIQFPSVQSAMINVFTIDGKLLYMRSISGQSQYALNIPGTANSRLLVIQVITKEKSTTFTVVNQ